MTKMRPVEISGTTILAFIMLVLVILSGCVAPPGQEIKEIAKTMPDVNAFFQEYPNATITATLWDEATTASNIAMLSEKCGEHMQVESYWYVIAEAFPQRKVELWLDANAHSLRCIVRTGFAPPSQNECSTDADCEDGRNFTRDICTGTPKRCIYYKITECAAGDNYCPAKCSYTNDTDCTPEADGCSTDAECNDANPCTADACVGTPKACVNTPTAACAAEDSCCPSGCSYSTDTDCQAVDECGTNAECGDGDYCTYDVCSSIPKVCSHPVLTTCAAGDNCCPANCDSNSDADCGIDLCSSNADCADASNATKDVCEGTPKRCMHYAITQCLSGDNYCPSGCNYLTDADCPLVDTCSTNVDCADVSSCTIDTCSGTPKACSHSAITACASGDNCCASGCTPITDSDCQGCIADANCSDANPCTQDSCVNWVCIHPTKPDGTTCDVNGGCISGTCVPPDPCRDVNCSDANPCTIDVCNPNGECGHAWAANGISCGTSKTCTNGVCNSAPVANAGADQSVGQGTTVTLNGSASYDPDGNIVSYVWKEGATVLSNSVSFTKSDFSVGTHTVALTVGDNRNVTATDTVVVTVSTVASSCQGKNGLWVLSAQLGNVTTVDSLLQTSDGNIYAGTSWNGHVFKTMDGGITWQDIGQIPNANSIYSLIQISNGAIYAGTANEGKVFKSTDGAKTWTQTGNLAITVTVEGSSFVYRLMQASDGVLYAGTGYGGEIFKSTNVGVTWVNKGALPSPGTDRISTIFESSGGTLYAAGGGGMGDTVYKSTNKGETWTNIGELSEIVGTLIELPDGSILAGTYGVFKYDGTDWISIWSDYAAYELVKAPDGTIYAATQTGDVYKSTNNGANWVSTGLNETRGPVALLAAKDGSVYATISGNGRIYRLCP